MHQPHGFCLNGFPAGFWSSSEYYNHEGHSPKDYLVITQLLRVSKSIAKQPSMTCVALGATGSLALTCVPDMGRNAGTTP